ncbi:MAG: fibronectin type III domain-containing protein [Paludibacteraceae bacterium]|nr:fibronectin type III domain-containing protein [Paludibacteraceae bacterium]
MKRFLSILTLSMAVLCASAADRYVKPGGSDSNDGSSWAKAKATISAAINASAAGDNVLIAAGTYNESVTGKNGVNIRGGYNPSTGARDMENLKSIIDATGLNKRALSFSANCTAVTYVEGLILENAEHTTDGGGAYIRGNVVLDHCTIRNCKGAAGGGICAIAASESAPAMIKQCTIELCESTSDGGGVFLSAFAIMDGCIVRGCDGKYGAVVVGNDKNNPGCIVRNTVIHNNSCTIAGWPASAGIYNRTGGIVQNCTVVNNFTDGGGGYTGIHSESQVLNSVFWGNRTVEGFADPVNYIGSSSKSYNNYADQGLGSFTNKNMSTDNTAASSSPKFNNPTTFIGKPTNAGEIAAMQNADFSLTEGSFLIDKGRANMAPETDILGVTRPIGSKPDVGAYEYDPNAPVIAVTGLSIYEDTIFIIQGQTGGASPIITPAKATNKRLTWSIDNTAIATVSANGAITGVTIGETTVRATTVDGNYKASAIVEILPIPPTKFPDEVIAADSLYPIENYTVPSFIPFWIAKEAARIDSLSASAEDIASIAGKIEKLNGTIAHLVPKTEPYNMVANINGDPKTNMAFCWFTNEGVTEGKVQLLPKANATAEDFATINGVITINATPTTTKPLNYAVSTSGIITATHMSAKQKFTYVSHKAMATNLTPGTTYSWRVGYDGHWSEIAQFTTKEAEQGEFSFVYMTDSHIMNQEYVDHARWCAEAVAKTAPDARFCLFPGDFVETGESGNSEWEWERWFEESIKPVIMKMPIVPTDGNHDDSPNLNYNYHFNTDNAFNQTAKTKPQFDGITYSFEYGDVLFLVYSLQDWWRASGSDATSRRSTYLSTDLKNWFYDQVESHPNSKYRVTLSHKNIFSGSGHSIDDETPLFRDVMLPIFADCQIDLAIQGHDHCYEVIGPVDPWKRTAIRSAITDLRDTTVNATTNATGKVGGTYTTDDGTLYFIGATCGRKRYSPYSRATMDENYKKHYVENYFDLFTGMFGQPGAPSFTKFTVKSDCIEINSYTADSNGDAKLLNTMKVKRTKEHTPPTAIENVDGYVARNGEKFVRNGQMFIRINDKTYNVLGETIE